MIPYSGLNPASPGRVRVVFRCPGCGATATATVRGGTVRSASLTHEDGCTWLAAAERGLPVAPVQVEVLEGGRP